MISLQRTASINGVELAWDEWGEGPGVPLLLVHGYTGSAHDFALQIEALSADRRVIAVDHRGHGLSSKLGRLDAYSLGQLRADLTSFIDTVVEGPVDLLGHSMGGYLSVWLTVERPDLVASLVLMDTSAWSFGSPEQKAEFNAFLAQLDPAAGVRPVGPPGPEQPMIDAMTSEEWRAEKQRFDTGLDLFAFKALGLELLGGEIPSAREHLAGVHIPVTVTAGSNDRPFVDHAADLAGCFPDAELALIDGGYHSPQLTHPDEWRSIIERHLTRAASRQF